MTKFFVKWQGEYGNSGYTGFSYDTEGVAREKAGELDQKKPNYKHYIQAQELVEK